MTKNIFRKSVAVAIIALFIGASITFTPNMFVKTAKADLTTGLVGYWNFDEGSGSTVHDSSSYCNDGTVYGASWTTDSISGNALSFDGVNDYVEIPFVDDFVFNDESVTFSAWVQIVDNAVDYRTFIFLGDANINDNRPYFFMGKSRSGYVDGRLFMNVVPDGQIGYIAVSDQDGEALPKDTWMHVVGVVNYEDLSIQLYINGNLQDSVPLGSYNLGAASQLKLRFGIPAFTTSGLQHKGLLDEIRIYNIALSAEEIQYLYNNPGGGNQPRFPVDNPLDGIYWKHAPGSGSPNYDPSYGGHHPGGGYGRADDTYALDLNWGLQSNSDLGKKVYAIEQGTIKQIDRAWGWVLIEHTTPLFWRGQTYNTWYSGYLHMQKIPVNLKEDDSVAKSTQIGEVGITKADSPHLHFAIYVGRIVDPSEPLFKKKSQNVFLESVDPGQVGGPEYLLYTYGDRGITYDWGQGAIYNHNVDELVKQDSEHWFEKGGSEHDWYETSSYGFYNHMFYSYTTKDSYDNWGRWNHKISVDGNYIIYVFIPRNFATAKKANYAIFCNGDSLGNIVINQNDYSDKWVKLGNFIINADDIIQVYLTDQTGEKNKLIGFDLVKIWMKQDADLPRT